MNLVSARNFTAFCLVAILFTSAGVATGSAPDLTYIEDDIHENTTWSPEEGPYRIAEDITIHEGATLEIKPGTTVQPAEDITITVRGNLTADGTATEPVTFVTAHQAPADIRWGTIQYNGTSHSRLALSHITLAKAQNAVTITSKKGTVEISSATVESIAQNGVEVTDVSVPPKLSVADSTFTNISGRGIAVTPAMGAVADSGVRPNITSLGREATHNIALSFRTDTPVETLDVGYHGHGDVNTVDNESIQRFGIDTDDDGVIDRSLTSQIGAVSHPRPNAFTIELNRSVLVSADDSLVVAYENVTNPQTYGSYPVTIQIRDKGVEQLAETTLPLTIQTTDDQSRTTPQSHRTRASRFQIVDSTFRLIDNQGVFVAADDARNFQIQNNTLVDIRGSGILVRGERTTDFRLSQNSISTTDAGIRIYTRNDNGEHVEIDSNTVTNSTTGLHVRHAHNVYVDRLSLQVANNRFAGNTRHGIAITARQARLTGFEFRGNTIAANGHTGISLTGEQFVHSTLAQNTITENTNAGVAIESEQVRHVRISGNELGTNRGHGLSLQTSLLVHNVSLDSNHVVDNAGIGINLDNQVTHAGSLNLTHNRVAANAYGIRIAGSVNAHVRNNSIVYNTYGFDTPSRFAGYETGTGIIVEEGAAGAIFRTGEFRNHLGELLDDPAIETTLRRQAGDEYMVVLRPNDPNTVWQTDETALTIQTLSGDLPTGITLPKDDDRRTGVLVHNNDVYGQTRGLVVNVNTLVDANTSTRLLVNTTQTVLAERNYWGAPDGPTHSSIHPEGTGDRIVTRHGWIDFIPVADSHTQPQYQRPHANLSVSVNSPTVGEEIQISGHRSTAPNGSIATYRFSTNQSTDTTTEPNHTISFGTTGNYTVSLSVENSLGIESAEPATRTITVRPQSNTTAKSEQNTTPDTTSSESQSTPPATPVSTQSAGFPLPQSSIFASIGGLLGLVFYGSGLALGAYGTLQTIRSTPVTVNGVTINGLAAVGVVVWLGFGLAGTDDLFRVGLGGGLLWGSLLILLWVVTVVLD